jgi:hypothetical protein
MWKLTGKVPFFLRYSKLLFLFYNLWFHGFVDLTAQLAAVQKALFEEKASWSTVDRSLAEEKTAHQTAE